VVPALAGAAMLNASTDTDTPSASALPVLDFTV